MEFEDCQDQIDCMISEGSPVCQIAKIPPKVSIKQMPTQLELEDYVRRMLGQGSGVRQAVVFNLETGKFEP